MNLKVGIVGLPNAGKSTLFNALAARRLSPTAAYPFTTIEPHEAVVEVPDDNLTRLTDLVKPEKSTPAAVTFIDIAGLVGGASQGEGLGNQFLAHIREVDAIVHVVRTFEDTNVPPVSGEMNPKEDIAQVNLELELAGITGRPTIYVVNAGEGQLGEAGRLMESIREVTKGSPVVAIAAKLEEEITDLATDEAKEYRKALGIEKSGLEKLIVEAYKILNLITFYTIKGGREVRAWEILRGRSALDAAAKVHTDFATHFIKAEVIPVATLLDIGSWHKAKEQGKVRIEGKDYIVQEGDVIEFKTGT